MRLTGKIFLISIIQWLLAACGEPAPTEKQTRTWDDLLPAGTSDTVYADPSNPPDEEKIAWGRYLFYDRRLSVNQARSCASCHDPAFGFTDGYRRSIGALGDMHQRNARPLVNLLLNKYLTAADSTLHFPEQQINNPMFHTNPVELGWTGNESLILSRVRNDTFYRRRFPEFLVEDRRDQVRNIQTSIAQFVKTIISFDSPYDHYGNGREKAFPESVLRGMRLFFSDSLACHACHGGANFNTPGNAAQQQAFTYYFNTGLYNLDGKGAYPVYDQGLFSRTGNPPDMGKYRVPTLRNLLFTAPYYHDGSAATIGEVIADYERGGRLTAAGDQAGDGRTNPFKNKLIKGFSLTSQERKDLVEFLMSLSDSSLLKNPTYSNPFRYDETRQ